MIDFADLMAIIANEDAHEESEREEERENDSFDDYSEDEIKILEKS